MNAAPPFSAIAYADLGLLLHNTGREHEAEKLYRRALALDPGLVQVHVNLGVLLACAKREEEAEQCYRSALALVPDDRDAHYNLAYLLLRQGRYEEGWHCLEHRNWNDRLAATMNLPRWRGEQLEGKCILIGIEGGHGDMIQFSRYAAELKRRGAVRVSVLCHPSLKRLMPTVDGVDDAISLGAPAVSYEWDYWTPPQSLPYVLGTRLDTIPARLPYLSPLPRLAQKWAQELGDTPTDLPRDLRVGMAWKGNPGFENDAERSLPSLHTLAALGQVPGVRFFSLQKGRGEDEAAQPPFPMVELGSRLGDFADTAAVISQLDLVIAVDTAVAHLAGALGKPCWLLLPHYKTDWRWMDAREDSPWYPQVMRLFRQDAGGTWSPVVDRVRQALQERVAGGPGS